MSDVTNKTPLHVVVNRYIIFTNLLLEAGWHAYGNKENFHLNPYTYKFGAVKFFEKEGKLYSICAALDTSDQYSVPNLAYAREYDLSGSEDGYDAFEKVFDTSMTGLGELHANLLINKYKETVILDFSAEKNQFIEFNSGCGGIFVTPEGETISKSISLTDVKTMSVLEAGYYKEQAEKALKSYDSRFSW